MNLFLDLSGVPCPQNVSRLLIHMAGLDSGQTLEVFLDAGEPFDNVMESLAVEGIQVLQITDVSAKKKKINLMVK